MQRCNPSISAFALQKHCCCSQPHNCVHTSNGPVQQCCGIDNASAPPRRSVDPPTCVTPNIKLFYIAGTHDTNTGIAPPALVPCSGPPTVLAKFAGLVLFTHDLPWHRCPVHRLIAATWFSGHLPTYFNGLQQFLQWLVPGHSVIWVELGPVFHKLVDLYTVFAMGCEGVIHDCFDALTPDLCSLL